MVLDYNTELRIIYQSDDAKQAVSNVMQAIKPAGITQIIQPVRMDVGSWSEVR
ncbi:MAG: hypothetical protein HQL75_18395 [Magnetococcales bacterium]|nr:hypothetical protein [Magnetococcales bacterium]